MRSTKNLVFLLLFVCCSGLALSAPWSGSGAYTVGTGGDYATLGDFFFAMNGYRQGNGTVSCVTTTTTLTGTGTLFTQQVQAGDWIVIPAPQFIQVSSVVSDTQLILATAPTAAQTNVVYEVVRGGVAAVSGNVTVEILSDLTEPNNLPLVGNLNGFSLTVKPYAGTQPTVTFTRGVDNAGFSGHVLVGAGVVRSDEIVNTMDNVTIDGSNNGSTSRDMAFVGAGAYDFESFVHVTGDNDNTVVKNMNLYMNSTAGGSSVNYFRATTRVAVALTLPGGYPVTYAGAGTHKPDAWRILNNNMTRTAGLGAHQAVISTNSGTVAAGTGQTGFEISDNYLTSRVRGVFLNQGSQGDIVRNTMLVGPVNGFDGFGILLNNANSPAAGTANYNDNFVVVTHANSFTNAAGLAHGPTGIMVSSAGAGADRVYNVKNNIVVCKYEPATLAAGAGGNSNIRGIHMTSGVTYNVFNNSVYLPTHPNIAAQTGTSPQGIGGWAAVAYYATLYNNIVRVDIPGIPCINRVNLGSGTFTSNYNDLSAAATAYTGRQQTTTYATLANWQTLGHDANSKDLDPFVAQPGYVGKWVSANNLHFAPDPGPAWQYGTTGAGIPTLDIDQETRSTPPYVGADDGPFNHVFVASAYSDANSPVPAVGYTNVTTGTLVSASAPDITTGGTKRVATGWTGQGSAPASGSTNSFTYTADDYSSITWSWKTQYQLTAAVSPPAGGSITGGSDGAYYDDATVLNLQAVPNGGWYFTGWSGDLAGTTNPQNLTINAPKSVTAAFVNQDIDTSPSIAFGNVEVGTSVTVILVVSNLGNTDLTVSGLNITGPNASDFFAVASLPLVIAGGSTGNIDVSFYPTAIGSYSATLGITSDDPDEATFNVALSGSGLVGNAQVSLDTPSLDFGTVNKGSPQDLTFTITNAGLVGLNVSALNISGTGSAAYSIVGPAVPFLVQPGLSQVVTVRFSPTLVQTYTAQVSIVSNDPASPTPVSLTGIGAPATNVDDWRLF